MCNKDNIIKGFSDEGYYIKLETVTEKEDIKVDGDIYENPVGSYTRLVMYDSMDGEVGYINLDNCDISYMARKLLESMVFF